MMLDALTEARRGECGQEKRPPPSARRVIAPQLTPRAVCSGRSPARCLVDDPAGQRCPVPGGAARLLPPGCAAAPLRARAMLFVCGSAKCCASAPGARPPRAEWSVLPLSASPPCCGPTSPAASSGAARPGGCLPPLPAGACRPLPRGLLKRTGGFTPRLAGVGLWAPPLRCASGGLRRSRLRFAPCLRPLPASRAPPLRRSPGPVGDQAVIQSFS